MKPPVKKKRTRKVVSSAPTVKPVPRPTSSGLSGEELFNAFSGRYARTGDKAGIICGHYGKKLIMAVMSGAGWLKTSRDDAVIVNYKVHKKGYEFVSEHEIID
jgi:hypothetical protein